MTKKTQKLARLCCAFKNPLNTFTSELVSPTDIVPTKTMKATYLKVIASILVAATATSCMTTYDAYGNPRQTVDPGVAIAGVAAAGVLGYAAARDRNTNYAPAYHDRGYHRGYYNGGYRNYGGYYGRSRSTVTRTTYYR